jgi:hypothetical protein
MWRNRYQRALGGPGHFIDLYRLLGEPTPAEADPTGTWFCFEKGAKKAGDGWADVWRRACYGWGYKGKGKRPAWLDRPITLLMPLWLKPTAGMTTAPRWLIPRC